MKSGAGEILREIFPDAIVSLSSEVAPEFREYFRASTTVINACIRPIVARYLRRIEDRLREKGIAAALLVMQSSGGVFTFASASEKPVFMVESGPRGGRHRRDLLRHRLGAPRCHLLRHGRNHGEGGAYSGRYASRDQGI